MIFDMLCAIFLVVITAVMIGFLDEDVEYDNYDEDEDEIDYE